MIGTTSRARMLNSLPLHQRFTLPLQSMLEWFSPRDADDYWDVLPRWMEDFRNVHPEIGFTGWDADGRPVE